jgi:hypothetical protein
VPSRTGTLASWTVARNKVKKKKKLKKYREKQKKKYA